MGISRKAPDRVNHPIDSQEIKQIETVAKIFKIFQGVKE